MNLNAYIKQRDEKPLDNIPQDGGMAAIFRTIACVGDSLSSGEFEVMRPDGTRGYYDMFEYSWGQFMARTLGSKVYNFSRGGMTAREYMETWGEANGVWDRDKAVQAYIFAMGCNDVSITLQGVHEWGSADDIKDNYADNAKTAYGYYAAMLQRYKLIQPDAKFFLMTMPVCKNEGTARFELYEKHQRMIYELAERFSNVYVLDFRRYAPLYDESDVNFWLNGHLNPAGYLLTAKMVCAYIDYIIRNNPEDFAEVGFIGTGIKNVKL